MVRRRSARDQTCSGFLGGDAVEINIGIHPESVCLKIGNYADGERRRAGPCFAESAEKLNWQIMGAENGIGREFFDKAGEFARTVGGKGFFPAGQFSDETRVVSFIEDHAPAFRG